MPENKSFGGVLGRHLQKYVVTYIFLAISVVGVFFSGMPLTAILSELVGRIFRNAFMILALLIPIVAGMGINFAVTIGAMAAQIAILLALNWKLPGIWGILAAGAITVPLGILFGIGIGKLLNKMKGQETIGSMILGYFANGAYQLLFLFVFGTIIPMSEEVTIVAGSGIKNSLTLMGENGMYAALDNLWKTSFSTAWYILSGILFVGALLLLVLKKIEKKTAIGYMAGAAVMAGVYSIPIVSQVFSTIRVPMITMLLIGLLCTFNVVIMRTKLGQKFRAVGQNRVVANASGINVDKVRMIAITISTVFAGWGHIIFIQNLGTLTAYSQHEQVGLYAGAAILVGGASIDSATNGQALIGCLLFHAMFTVVQKVASNLFGDPNIGEYFRVFLCYGVIALALVIYTWRNAQEAKMKLRQLR
ncbi:MAG: ABC transporter permease subunit [Christensenellales bacterium]